MKDELVDVKETLPSSWSIFMQESSSFMGESDTDMSPSISFSTGAWSVGRKHGIHPPL